MPRIENLLLSDESNFIKDYFIKAINYFLFEEMKYIYKEQKNKLKLEEVIYGVVKKDTADFIRGIESKVSSRIFDGTREMSRMILIIVLLYVLILALLFFFTYYRSNNNMNNWLNWF